MSRSVGIPLQHVRRFLAQTGGVRKRPRVPQSRHLTPAEREEISRGLAMGCSARMIAVSLGRSPSRSRVRCRTRIPPNLSGPGRVCTGEATDRRGATTRSRDVSAVFVVGPSPAGRPRTQHRRARKALYHRE
uniref:helix-turn-helix domain-containing protein n=1 Tax=Nocardia testacea TaxID=248551 RepID=UPI003571005C